jgi:hypothetical protein
MSAVEGAFGATSKDELTTGRPPWPATTPGGTAMTEPTTETPAPDDFNRAWADATQATVNTLVPPGYRGNVHSWRGVEYTEAGYLAELTRETLDLVTAALNHHHRGPGLCAHGLNGPCRLCGDGPHVAPRAVEAARMAWAEAANLALDEHRDNHFAADTDEAIRARGPYCPRHHVGMYVCNTCGGRPTHRPEGMERAWVRDYPDLAVPMPA